MYRLWPNILHEALSSSIIRRLKALPQCILYGLRVIWACNSLKFRSWYLMNWFLVILSISSYQFHNINECQNCHKTLCLFHLYLFIVPLWKRWELWMQSDFKVYLYLFIVALVLRRFLSNENACSILKPIKLVFIATYPFRTDSSPLPKTKSFFFFQRIF